MATGLSIVTGGGTGIGAALSRRLAARGPVLIVGRRLGPLEETRKSDPHGNIRIVAADVSTAEGRDAVLDAVAGKELVSALVHNAGMLEPVMPLAEVGAKEWRNAISTNLDAPLFLTQAVLPRMSRGGRILHISSGAAKSAYEGWGAYCVSKAGLNMMYRVLAKELEPRGIYVGSVRPGVVDTPMQDHVREADERVFPMLAKFLTLKESGSLMKPADTARFVDWLLNGVDGEEFSAQEWDIRETDRQRWADFN
uniref:Short-chain dehydrogenase n=1 Tax=Odontella aurita TaxID=265563 RepID=A0A7S4JEB1_9STRA|mmetsp:Transcript_4483/g.12449  ORF Transcript_4483/g.12449 Transcript_4483/m.12449 type:complete len:253 (+) Transcript_4483:44-802(+)